MSDEDLGIMGRVHKWFYGKTASEDDKDSIEGIQRLTALSVWVPLMVCLVIACFSKDFIGVLAASVAALGIGSFFGLLFGTPRGTDNGYSTQGANASPKGNTGPDGEVIELDSAQSPSLVANNNFTKIADWATSAIVGVALVELKEIAGFMKSLVVLLAGNEDRTLMAAYGGVLVSAFFAGFIWTFLNARIILMKLFRDADPFFRDKSAREKLNLVSLQTSQIASRLENIWASDPNKNNFGGEPKRNNRELGVGAIEETGSNLELELFVRSTTDEKAIEGEVTFYLHPTYSNQVRTVAVVEGVARLSISLVEAFTIGATCDGGKTRLELDLENVAGIPDKFKTNV